jgi:hypothetical protein
MDTFIVIFEKLSRRDLVQQKLNFMGADKLFESLAQLRNTSKPIKIGLFKI